MYPTNRFYGHDVILGAYAGRLPGPPPIIAHLQHGWNPWTGFGRRYLDRHGDRRPLLPGLPKLVWNQRNIDECRRRGLVAAAISAPLVYLDAMLRGRQPVEQHATANGVTTIVYPYHNGANNRVPRDERAYVQQILEREGPGATVCLYWREFDEPEIRTPYDEAGFRVISHGTRTDPFFLVRQHGELLRHRRVVTNRAASALWYGGFLGLEMEVYGPVFGSGTVEEGRDFEVFQRAEWPELVSGAISGERAIQLAAAELGAEFVRDPEELRRLLGWEGLRRAAWAPVHALLKLQRRIRGNPMRE